MVDVTSVILLGDVLPPLVPRTGAPVATV